MGLDDGLLTRETSCARCSLIGLTPAQAKDALTINPQRAIARGSECRRREDGEAKELTTSDSISDSGFAPNLPRGHDESERCHQHLESCIRERLGS